MYYLVYEIQNLVNDKIYVGVHKTDNPDDSYLGSGVAITRAVNKYGRDNFKKTILHSFDNADDAYLTEAEIVTVDFVACPDTYNMKTGGSSGWEHSEETRQKISITQTGKKASDKARQNMRIAQSNISDETRQKISNSKSNPTDETRQNMSNAASNRSAESRRNMGNARKKKFKITYPDGNEEIVLLMDWSAANGLVYEIVKKQINKGIINAGERPNSISETRRFLIGYRIDRM